MATQRSQRATQVLPLGRWEKFPTWIAQSEELVSRKLRGQQSLNHVPKKCGSRHCVSVTFGKPTQKKKLGKVETTPATHLPHTNSTKPYKQKNIKHHHHHHHQTVCSLIKTDGEIKMVKEERLNNTHNNSNNGWKTKLLLIITIWIEKWLVSLMTINVWVCFLPSSLPGHLESFHPQCPRTSTVNRLQIASKPSATRPVYQRGGEAKMMKAYRSLR